jgi:hypothetical protein
LTIPTATHFIDFANEQLDLTMAMCVIHGAFAKSMCGHGLRSVFGDIQLRSLEEFVDELCFIEQQCEKTIKSRRNSP